MCFLKIVERWVVARISRPTGHVPNEDVSFPILRCSDSSCSQTCHQHSRVSANLSQSLPWYFCTSDRRSQLLRRLTGMPSYGLVLS